MNKRDLIQTLRTINKNVSIVVCSKMADKILKHEIAITAAFTYIMEYTTKQ